MHFDILEDGEPAQEVEFPVRPGTDSRFFRAFAFKPTVEGVNMTLQLRLFRDNQMVATATCTGVTVLP